MNLPFTPIRPLLVALSLVLGLTFILPAEAATFTVTNTNDSGAGSLRQAILDANANPGADTIVFAIGAPGSSQTIAPTSGLPALTDPVILDGWSQGGPGYTGPPLIELSGSAIGATVRGLDIRGGDSLVRGLVINDFPCDGMRLVDAGNNWVYGNYLGTDITGTRARPNGSAGNC